MKYMKMVALVAVAMMAVGCSSTGIVKNGGQGYPQNQGSTVGAAIEGVAGQAVNTFIIELNTEAQYRVRREMTQIFGR